MLSGGLLSLLTCRLNAGLTERPAQTPEYVLTDSFPWCPIGQPAEEQTGTLRDLFTGLSAYLLICDLGD